MKDANVFSFWRRWGCSAAARPAASTRTMATPMSRWCASRPSTYRPAIPARATARSQGTDPDYANRHCRNMRKDTETARTIQSAGQANIVAIGRRRWWQRGSSGTASGSGGGSQSCAAGANSAGSRWWSSRLRCLHCSRWQVWRSTSVDWWATSRDCRPAVDVAALSAAKVLDTTGSPGGGNRCGQQTFGNNIALQAWGTVEAPGNIVVEYSNTLPPFVAGTNPPLYARVTATGFSHAGDTVARCSDSTIFRLTASAMAGPSRR